MTWQFYQLDRTMWANGAMYEVEPDVVLYVYGGGGEPQELRYQVIRVTPHGVEPVRWGDNAQAETKAQQVSHENG